MKTTEKERNVAVAILAIVGVLWLLSLAPAGDLEPASAPGSTMHTLEEIYNLHAPAKGFEPSVDRGTSDIFMRVEGVEGEAQDKDHKNWSEVASFQQAHATPPGGTSGSTRRGNVVFQDFVVLKPLDKASPKLAEAVCRGTVFPQVEIHVTGSYDGSGGRVTYLVYTLKNVMVVSYSLSGTGQAEDVPTEEVGFVFEEIKVEYTERDNTGLGGGIVEYQWRIEAGV